MMTERDRQDAGTADRKGWIALGPLVVWLALAIAAGPAPAAAAETALTLTILHTNDVHARLAPVNRFGAACRPRDLAGGRCYGGVARLHHMVTTLRATAANLLVLDAGDQFQGSLFYSRHKSAALTPFLNRIGYDAVTLGNHEFDDGPTELARYLVGLTATAVSANLMLDKEPQLVGLVEPYTVREIDGVRVGIVGLTSPDTAVTALPGPTIGFRDPAMALAEAVAALEGEGVGVIIALTHVGLNRDLALAARVDGVDVIVGGDSHSLLSNRDPAALGPYPTVVTGPGGQPVLVVQAGSSGRYLGRLEVAFDAAGVPVAWDGEPIRLDQSVPETPEILVRVAALAASFAALKADVVGATDVALPGGSAACRFGECALGNLVADAMLWRTRAAGTEIAIQNGGGLRASLPAGPITRGQVLEVLPFANTIATFGLSGAEIVAALEIGVSRAEAFDNPGTGRFPQVAGLRFTWSPARAVGSRVVSVAVPDGAGGWAAIEADRVYRVVSNNFLRAGGDGYTVFAEHGRDAYDAGPNLDEALVGYLAARGTVAPRIEGRIRRADG